MELQQPHVLEPMYVLSMEHLMCSYLLPPHAQDTRRDFSMEHHKLYFRSLEYLNPSPRCFGKNIFIH